MSAAQPVSATMRAAVFDSYGGPEVVRLDEVPTPKPGPGEVLVKVRASTIASADWRMRSKTLPEGFGWMAPLMFGKRPRQRVLGTELSGVIVAVGTDVEQWQIGAEVFAFPGGQQGAHAEYVVVPCDGKIAAKPKGLSFEEAAAMCFGGSTALSFIEKGGGIAAGEHALVVGASGAVGAAMVQLAKHFGAAVTAVTSTGNVEWARALGADEVIDYRRRSFVDVNTRYDVIVDTVGTASPRVARGLLTSTGRMLLVHASMADMIRSLWQRGVVAGPANEDPAHLPELGRLADAGAYRPQLDEVFTFDEIVEAHRRVDSGRKRGNVVVKWAD